MRDYKQLSLQSLLSIPRQTISQPNIKIDLTHTQYTTVRTVAIQLYGWKIWRRKQDKKQQVTVSWRDSYINQEYLRKMLPFQKVNRFPGSYQLGKKSNLSFIINRMSKIMPLQYNFYPKTWVIPKQNDQFKSYIKKNPQAKFISKPQAGCQGRGIILLSKPQQYEPTQTMVIQLYIKDPFLIQGLKFDFRLYVLLKSVDPLRLFLYQQGLARFATTQYSPPDNQNLTFMNLHLTNYAINRKSPDFVYNTSVDKDYQGHKRSFSSVLNLLKDQGYDVNTLMYKIQSLIIKTFSAASPYLKQQYSLNCNNRSDLCFELFGVDILINKNLQPFLLQVNHTPSFATDTPLDMAIKKSLIYDTLRLLNINSQNKKTYFDEKPQNRRRIKFQSQQQGQLGGYIRIHPTHNSIYNRVIKASFDNWAKANGLKRPISQAIKHKCKIRLKSLHNQIQIGLGNDRTIRPRVMPSISNVIPEQDDSTMNSTSKRIDHGFNMTQKQSIRQQQEQLSRYFLRPKLRSFIDQRLKIVIQEKKQQQNQKKVSFFKTNLSQIKQMRDIRYLKQLRQLNSRVIQCSIPQGGNTPLQINGQNLTIKYAPKMRHVVKR